MITDPLFYRLFETSPETFFLVLGMPADAARAMAARYQYRAIEFKETAHRADGVFEPESSELPVYFLEVQYYALASVYADVLAKAYTYLKQHDPRQTFCAVVLFGSRELEPDGMAPYQALLDAGILRRVFLDEMPAMADAPLGLAIVHLIGQGEEQAATTARALVARAKSEIADASLCADLVQLIETVIIYKLPRLGREEIQAMLQVHNIRETRVYQEALQEGIQQGIEKGIKKGIEKGIERGIKKGIEKGVKQGSRKEKLKLIPKLAARKMSAQEISSILGLDVALVRNTMSKKA